MNLFVWLFGKATELAELWGSWVMIVLMILYFGVPLGGFFFFLDWGLDKAVESLAKKGAA